MKIDWLRGIRVVISGNYVPAPLAGWLLGVLGAEIIRLEQSGGDLMRKMPPFLGEGPTQQSAFFEVLNAGAKSICVDFKHPDAGPVLASILKQADIVIDGNRAGYLEKFLPTPIAEMADGPVYISMTGFGMTGPLAHQAAHDNNALALAGMLSYTTPAANGGPAPFSAPVADMMAAFSAALCAVAAMQDRKSSIKQVDASLLHSAFFMNLLQLSTLAAGGNSPQYGKEWMNGGLGQYQSYKTADGKFVFLGTLEPHLFGRFLLAIQRPDLIPLLSDHPELTVQTLGEIFLSRSQKEWQDLGENMDICLTPVLTLDESIAHPHIQQLGLMQTVEHPEFGRYEMPVFPAGFGPKSTMPERPKRSPQTGGNTTEICRDLLVMDEISIAQGIASGLLIQA